MSTRASEGVAERAVLRLGCLGHPGITVLPDCVSSQPE